MARVALVTAKAALSSDEDLDPLLTALENRELEADSPCWDDDGVVWGAYDLIVLRSPWDYVPRYGEFLRWLEATAEQAPVLNDPRVVRWNTDKHYLADLAARGLPVVPTQFFEPGGTPQSVSPPRGDLVVKPVISAGSKDTTRHSDPRAAERHVRALLAQRRAVMVQPFLTGIETHGETGLLYFDGSFSHGFRKGPILERDAPPTAELFAPEDITAREPTREERAVADDTIAACGGADLLYGRVDLVPDADGRPRILEVELTEPSYFVTCAPASADRFAAAVERRVAMTSYPHTS